MLRPITAAVVAAMFAFAAHANDTTVDFMPEAAVVFRTALM